MARPKLKEEDKKIKLSITLSSEVNNILNSITNNKSKTIEDLILKLTRNEK